MKCTNKNHLVTLSLLATWTEKVCCSLCMWRLDGHQREAHSDRKASLAQGARCL